MANTVIFDLETYSTVDLRQYGVFRYARCSEADVICGAFAGVKTLTDYNILGFKYNEEPSKDLFGMIEDCKTLIAHNIEFDYEMYTQVLMKKYKFPDIRNKALVCTRKRQAFLGLPESLKHAAIALKLTQRKDESGVNLIQRLSLPNKDGKRNYDPDLEKKMYDYCQQDIVTTINLFFAQNILLGKALGVQDKSQWDLRAQQLDTKINMVGVPVNLELAAHLSDLKHEELALAQLEVIKLCGNDFNMPSLTQTEVLKNYLKDKFNYDVGSFTSNYSDAPAEVKQILDIRKNATKSTLAKADSVLALHVDGRLKGQFKYYGAHTGRFAGRDFQIQNLPKTANEDDPRSFLRNLIAAYKGNTLVFVDYAAIEHRILFYLACELMGETNNYCDATEAHFNKIKNNDEVYLELAADIYHVPVESLTKKSIERILGKVAHLGLGYLMGATVFKSQCETFNVRVPIETVKNLVYPDKSLEEVRELLAKEFEDPRIVEDKSIIDTKVNFDLAQHIVQTYRKKYRGIQRLWYYLRDVFISVAKSKEDTEVPMFLGMKLILRHHKYVEGINRTLTLILPSGRPLFYHNFQFVEDKWPDGSPKEAPGYSNGKFIETLHGGTIAENIIQAISRDILVQHMLEIDEKIKNCRIIGHVHDEVLLECADTTLEATVKKVEAIMTTSPKWAKNLPLAVESTVSKYYRK